MFKSLKNFRPVGGELFSSRIYGSLSEFNTQKVKVFRSARPDLLVQDDLDEIAGRLGIKSVIDFRDFKTEYKKENGSKLLDGSYKNAKVVDIEKMDKSSTSIKWKTDCNMDENQYIQHIMVNFFGREFVKGLAFGGLLSIWQIFWVLLLSILSIFIGTKQIWMYIKNLIDQRGLLFLYKMIIDTCGISIRTSLKLLNMEENLPAIICCHAGKDRTGIMSALLLSICGCDRKAIVHDYSMSEVAFPVDGNDLSEYSEQIRRAPRHVISELLDYIEEKYASVELYLVAIGFTVQEQNELKKRILL